MSGQLLSSWISSALSARTLSKLYNQRTRNKTTQKGPRWPLSVRRPERLFCASLILRAEREHRWALFSSVELGATFSAYYTPQTTAQRSPRVKSHCGETENGMPREISVKKKKNKLQRSSHFWPPFSPSPVSVESFSSLLLPKSFCALRKTSFSSAWTTFFTFSILVHASYSVSTLVCTEGN